MDDQDAIEIALRRVHSGELSPAQATQLLVNGLVTFTEQPGEAGGEGDQAEARDQADSESLVSLIDRLGPPPKRLVDRWCKQLHQIAFTYEQEAQTPLPAIEFRDCGITARGSLAWRGIRFHENADAGDLSPQSSDQLRAFRAKLLAGGSGILAGVSDSGDLNPNVELAVEARPKQTEAEKSPIGGKPVALVAAVLFCLSIPLLLVLRGSPEGRADRLDDDRSAGSPVDEGRLKNGATHGTAPTESLRPPVPPSQGTSPHDETVDPATSAALETLETLHSTSEAEIAAMEAEAIVMESTASLDQLVTSETDFLSPPQPSDAPTPVERTDAEPAISAIEPSRRLDDADVQQDPPQESMQETSARGVMSVALPATDSLDQSISLSDSPWNDCQLEFPLEIPLQLIDRPGDDGSAWQIQDEKKAITIATVLRESDGMRFRWTTEADQSPAAQSLVSGRLRDSDDNMIYLRPSIEAEPWPIEASQPDVMPVWDLRYPIPTRAARLSITFHLPEDVEQVWIEPVSAESLRKGHGVAILTPRQSQQVALGIRFDIRCNRKLSCRMRLAGRLDPSLPWQLLSNPLLQQQADQWTNQAAAISREATRLAAVYEIADASGRRILRIKQNRNDAQAEMIRTALQRNAELQTLIAQLESEGSIALRVWVEWPDGQQEILTMPGHGAAR